MGVSSIASIFYNFFRNKLFTSLSFKNGKGKREKKWTKNILYQKEQRDWIFDPFRQISLIKLNKLNGST